MFVGKLCKQSLHTIPLFLLQYFINILFSFDVIFYILYVFFCKQALKLRACKLSVRNLDDVLNFRFRSPE